MTGISEDQLEREIVLADLEGLGWSTVYGPTIAPGEPSAERGEYREVVLVGRLRDALRRLNPSADSDAVEYAIKALLRPESSVVMTENWRAYQLLVDGVPVQTRDSAGAPVDRRLRVIDFENPLNNDLVAVNQFTIQGKDERRPDILLFVNGLPLVLIELKKPGEENASIRGAHNQVKTYVTRLPDLFTWVQLCVISDGVQARVGTHSAPWEHYQAWRTIDGEGVDDEGVPQIEVLVQGLLNPTVLLNVLERFIVFADEDGKVAKKVAKYHQYWAVRKAVVATLGAVAGDGRAGVVWHTQGSGKSLEMEWYCASMMKHPKMENPTIVVLTDRNDLDDQLFDEFVASRPGAPLPEPPVQAETRDHLKELLSGRQSGGIIFSTLQKFALSRAEKDAGTSFPQLSSRSNIVVVVDEAHRSNYDFIDGFARHLRDGLPNAAYIGFTGTPVESGDKSTQAVFGNIIDVYDLTQAVEDGATVKVLYEPRLAKVELPREALTKVDEGFKDATSGTEDEARDRLKSRWAQVEAIVGSEKRIAELAADIVEHWKKRREVLAGKALIVAMSRRIAVALYDEIVRLEPSWGSEDEAGGLIKVVITGSASDDESLQPHIRGKKALRALKKRAKDAADPLELVIVRDMWLTGFDSPSMHTMYLDKPMRGAPLMQAIARVNRTFKDKPAGLVVDYFGIADDLKKGLAEYTQRDQENEGLGQEVTEQALPELVTTHGIVADILHPHPWRENLAKGGAKAYLRALTAVVEHLLASHPGDAADPCSKNKPCAKHRFLAQTRRLVKLYTMCVPHEGALALRDDVAFFEAVRSQISKIEGSDRREGDPNATVDTAIKQLVSEALAGEGVIDIYKEAGLERPDLSLIDASFIEKVRESERPNLQIEMLKRLLSQEIRLVGKRSLVGGRAFSEMLEASILRYQNRTLDAAQVVAELVALAEQLKAEGERGGKLGLKYDELAFYDAICTNGSAVLEIGDETLKTIARQLVEIVRRDAKTDWSVKEQVRAKLRATIKRLLLANRYPPDEAPGAVELILAQAEVMARDAA